jgi:hypothetical protein
LLLFLLFLGIKVRTEHTGVELPEYKEDDESSSDEVANKSESDFDDKKMAANMEEMLRYKNSLPPPPPPGSYFFSYLLFFLSFFLFLFFSLLIFSVFEFDIDMTADEYFDPSETESVHLGRPQKLQMRVKSFKSKVWCSEDFPLTLSQLLTVLRPLAPSSVFVQRIVEFLEFDLPPGFPLKIGLCN